MSDYASAETRDVGLPPLWASPFPPEKERRDAPPEPERPKHEFEVEDRRYLDSARRRAALIDSLLMLPVYAALNLTVKKGYVGGGLLTAAVALTYFFVMEASTGQTVGKRIMKLRVVMRNGTPAPANAIAARTAIRLIDAPPFGWLLGCLVMVLTGGRRQRLGDLAARTIVRKDDRPALRAPHSPLIAVYPILWIGLAIFGIWQFNFWTPHVHVEGRQTANPYMRQVDNLCRVRLDNEAALAASGTNRDAVLVYVRELGAIESMPPAPPSAAHDMRIVRRSVRTFLHKIGRGVSRLAETSDPKLAARLDRDLDRDFKAMQKKFRGLGLPYCASGLRVSD